MDSGLSGHVFPDLWIREVSGAGDEEVFETKASPPAVAGPLTVGCTPSTSEFLPTHTRRQPDAQTSGSRP